MNKMCFVVGYMHFQIAASGSLGQSRGLSIMSITRQGKGKKTGREWVEPPPLQFCFFTYMKAHALSTVWQNLKGNLQVVSVFYGQIKINNIQYRRLKQVLKFGVKQEWSLTCSNKFGISEMLTSEIWTFFSFVLPLPFLTLSTHFFPSPNGPNKCTNPAHLPPKSPKSTPTFPIKLICSCGFCKYYNRLRERSTKMHPITLT